MQPRDPRPAQYQQTAQDHEGDEGEMDDQDGVCEQPVSHANRLEHRVAGSVNAGRSAQAWLRRRRSSMASGDIQSTVLR
jgi:hypothetical protein